MTHLEVKLKAALQRLALAPASKVLIGVSGGADSMALLHAMGRLRVGGEWAGEIYSAHVNHKLRGIESDQDAKFVEDWTSAWAQAHKLALPSMVSVLDVAVHARETGLNLEATARQVRYDFFCQVTTDYQIPFVLTAHTFDDQSETLVMRWVRGTGAKGLRGIHARRPLCEGVELIRPLLDVTRAEVLEHCAHYGVPYRTDSSNLSDDYTRNRVRHQLLPLLREFNPQFEIALQRSAEFWQADAECLDTQAAALFEGAVLDDSLLINEVATAHTALRMRVFRLWLGERLQLTARQAQALEQLLLVGQSGRTIQLPNGWRVTREFERLRLWQANEKPSSSLAKVKLVDGQPQVFGRYEFTLNKEASADAVFSIVLPAHIADSGLWVRARQAGDAYVPTGRNSPVRVKALMIQRRIPLTQRATHPLLVTAEDDIVWSPQLPLAASFQSFAANSGGEGCVWVEVRERCNRPLLMGVMSDRARN